jgi:putative FmdB family regulatory protein
MPTYTYKCKNCDLSIDEIHSIKEDPEILCGNCGTRMERIISGCNFVLKGGGWGRDQIEKKERETRSEKQKVKTTEKLHYGQNT